MKKFLIGLMAFFALSLAHAGPIVYTQAVGEGWKNLERELEGAKAIKDGNIEVAVLGALAHIVITADGRLSELPEGARSESGVIQLMENVYGKEIAVDVFRQMVKSNGGIMLPVGEVEAERMRNAKALATLTVAQEALKRELAKLAQEKSQAASAQRAEVARLQREIAGLEREVKAQVTNQGKRLGESLAAATAARSALEAQVKQATDKALTITDRVRDVEKQVTALEAAPIFRNGNYVMGALAVVFLGLVILGGLFATQGRRIKLAEKLARSTAKIPEETVKLANTTYVMVKEAQLTAQNAQSDIAIMKTAVNEVKSIATETKAGFEKLRAEVQRDIEIPDNLRGALRELTTDNPSHRATVSVDEQSFTLSFVFAEEGKVFVRGIKDQENAVAIDRVPSVIRRAARDNRVVGWEAMQRKDPAPKPTVLRQVQPPTASEDSLLARAAARARPTEVDVLVG